MKYSTDGGQRYTKIQKTIMQAFRTQTFGGIAFLLHQNETARRLVSTHLVRLQFGNYSYRNDLTGFALAALKDCQVTVSNATPIAKTAAIMNISVPNSI